MAKHAGGMNLGMEIREIGKLITSATLIRSVRNEVSKVVEEGFVGTDGSHHHSASGYEVVVRCGNENSAEIARRIRAEITNVNVDRISDGVLGIRTARRGKL